jgi:hypothetical protein
MSDEREPGREEPIIPQRLVDEMAKEIARLQTMLRAQRERIEELEGKGSGGPAAA